MTRIFFPAAVPARLLRRAFLWRRAALCAVAGAAFFMAVFPLPAAAHGPVCDRRADVLARLAEKYGEAPTGEWGIAGGAVVEVLVSPEGSWTLILTQATGISCLMATGEDWQGRRPPPPPPPEEGGT